MPLDLRWVLKKHAGGHDIPVTALGFSGLAINIQRSPDGEKSISGTVGHDSTFTGFSD